MAKLFEASRSLNYHEPVTPDQTIKANKKSDTMRLSAVTACHSYNMTPIPTSYTSPPYRSLTTFQHPNQFCTLRCLHQVLEDGCVQPVLADGNGELLCI